MYFRGPRRRDIEKGTENFEEIIGENHPKLRKETVSYRNTKSAKQDEPKEIHTKAIIIKMTKIKDKDRILRATMEKQLITYKKLL